MQQIRDDEFQRFVHDSLPQNMLTFDYFSSQNATKFKIDLLSKYTLFMHITHLYTRFNAACIEASSGWFKLKFSEYIVDVILCIVVGSA